MSAQITPLRGGRLFIGAGWPIFSGLVQRVEGTKLTFMSEKKERVVETNAKTRVVFLTSDGKQLAKPREGKLEEIEVGSYAMVAADDGGLARIIYMNPVRSDK
jgi:hypothetical protein